MHKTLALMTLVLGATLVAAPAQATGTAFTSLTQLSAAQEVSEVPVDSDGNAAAVVSFAADLSSFQIFVAFDNLVGTEVTRLHFHCQVAGNNGPVAIGLIDRLNPANDNSDDVTELGQVFFGELENDDFPADNGCVDQIGRPINNVASLAAAIDAGLVYWNLHTNVFGPGELRGQVRPTVETRALPSISDASVIETIPSADVPAQIDDAVRDLQINR